MSGFVELAPAKINLSLAIKGKRDDGYHELESLVVFALNAADRLIAVTGTGLSVGGPMASGLEGVNLVSAAVSAVEAASGRPSGLGIALEKHLPVASGIGGGSADAAAALRLLARSEPALATAIDLEGIARGLGADVPVCLASRAAMMGGAGERLTAVTVPAGPAIVLVNAMGGPVARKTARVFEALNAPVLVGTGDELPVPRFTTGDDLIAYVAERDNDLQRAATGVMGEIADVLAALRASSGCAVARLSGAGPTCFGLYRSLAAAQSAAAELAAHHDRWWVKASPIG